MESARMESRGRWFPEIVQVHAILGQRAISRGQMSEARLQSLLVDLCHSLGLGGPPSPATTRRWAADMPGYPERAVRTGVVPASALRPWALETIAWDQVGVDMHQSSASPRYVPGAAGREQRSMWADDLVRLGAVAFGLWVLGQIRRPRSTRPRRRRGFFLERAQARREAPLRTRRSELGLG